MILIQILSVMFSLGCVGGTLFFGYYLWTDREKMFSLLIIFIGLPVACLVAALPWALLDRAGRPDLATLKKLEWHCTDSHQEVTVVTTGRVVVPINQSVCDQYERK